MLQNLTRHMTPKTASFALLLGGAMWGLFWMPVRYLEHLGLEATWAGVFIYSSTLLVLSPAIWFNRRNIADDWRKLIWSGAFTGAAFGLWTISLFYTDVVMLKCFLKFRSSFRASRHQDRFDAYLKTCTANMRQAQAQQFHAQVVPMLQPATQMQVIPPCPAPPVLPALPAVAPGLNDNALP